MRMAMSSLERPSSLSVRSNKVPSRASLHQTYYSSSTIPRPYTPTRTLMVTSKESIGFRSTRCLILPETGTSSKLAAPPHRLIVLCIIATSLLPFLLIPWLVYISGEPARSGLGSRFFSVHPLPCLAEVHNASRRGPDPFGQSSNAAELRNRDNGCRYRYFTARG
ncbi:hypothetical protein F4677DRAFT_409927 [Hypoxylon crocopeplum]|nr:hypothetical protein F4677DRAFT_409927 [Hypoxylon crocopeplum]